MERPGRAYRTKTLFIEGVINDLINKLEVKFKETLDDYGDETPEVINSYFDQDLENFNGAIDLLYNLGFITKLENAEATSKGYDLYFKYEIKPRNIN